jgi:purine nucleoside phosphorylase
LSTFIDQFLPGQSLHRMYVPNAATTDFAKTPSWTGPAIHVGVIGGSGLYKLEGMEVVAEINPITVSGRDSQHRRSER